MSLKSKMIKIGLPLLILIAGLVVMRTLILSRHEPVKEVREDPGALVEVMTVTRGERQVRVQGTGTVQPRREISLVPQVDGRVLETAPGFIAGGFFQKGEILFRIEDADYRLALDRAQAALAKAEYDLATMEGQARIARQEWDRLQLGNGEEPNPLVLFEPQMKNAQAALLSAKASLQQAELDLDRTVLRAPFNCMIRSESVDVGQYIRAGTSVAMLAGTDQAEIVVPLPLEELAWLQIPGPGSPIQGSAATIQLVAGEETFSWQGRVVRRLGDVDPQGRMVRLVVAVNDPYGLQKKDGRRPDLALGTFVQVVLEGARLQDVAVIPASALRDGKTVWVMNSDHLKIRPVEVVRRTRDEVVIGNGLAAGERVLLTNLGGAAEGMKLRVVGEAPAAGTETAEEVR
ncbi:MAG: efflux RND transporter periplasmic adaptor subunit [Syntrophotaleaceae bacterium]